MKKTALLLATLTAMTLSSTSSFAYLYDSWESVSPVTDAGIDQNTGSTAGLDILRAYYAADTNHHYFRIDLNALPASDGFNYGVVIDNDGSGTVNYPLPDTSADYLLLRIGVDGVSGPVSVQNNLTHNGDGSKALEWSVARESIGDRFDWFSFAYKENKQSVAYDLTEKVTVTPIPGAAWLLGSGLVGLLGLRRRNASR